MYVKARGEGIFINDRTKMFGSGCSSKFYVGCWKTNHNDGKPYIKPVKVFLQTKFFSNRSSSCHDKSGCEPLAGK